MPKVLIGLLLLILIAAVGFSLWQQNTQNAQTSSVVIRTGKTYWPGQFWKEIAEEKGWFKEAGLTVELIDANQDYYQSLQDMVDGKMEANAFPPFDFMAQLGKGSDIVAVINTDVSTGIDAIIGNSTIQGMQDLKGKRIAVPKGTFGEYLLTVALERYNMKPADVIIVDAQAEKTHEALLNGTADAAVTYEPYISETITKIGARRLFDTSDEFGINSSLEAFHRSFIKEHPDLVQKYVAVWHKTTTFIKEHPDEAYAIIAKKNNATVTDVAELVKGDQISDLEYNKVAFSYASGFNSLPQAFNKLNLFMLDGKLIDKELDSTKYLDKRFVNELE